MGEDLGTIGETIVNNVPNENNGGSLSSIVVDTQVINGQVVADQAQIGQLSGVNSRNQ